jgi:predicted RNA binding protein YcfA (HicA-like mRNA interferase family)
MLKAYARARPKTSALDHSLQELWHVFFATSDQRARDHEPTVASGLQRKHEILMDTFVKVNRSHIIMRRDNPFAQTVVPAHREMDRGILRAILRQTDIRVEDFIRLL